MKRAIITLLICTLIGLSFGIYFYFNDDHRPERIFLSLLSNVSIGSLIMLGIYNRQYFTGFTSIQSLKASVMICWLVVAALFGTEFTAVMYALLWKQPYHWFAGGSIYVLNILISLVIGIPVYVSEEWKGMLNARISGHQYRVLQLEQQQTVFELELLRAKINPHFLYNVHNTIAGLISKDPQKAEELVLLLSKFFRFTLNKNSATFHSIKDELEIISTYLHMQQIRYESRLQYTIDAEQELLHLQMPSFILQPLVENAVKHGIEISAADGFISVLITTNAETIVIAIADSGPAFSTAPGTGLGLQMVMNKLRLLYGTDFEIEFNNPPKKYVRLIIPRRN